MPPRLPTRALSALPIAPCPASSSSCPLPPRPASVPQRGLHAGCSTRPSTSRRQNQWQLSPPAGKRALHPSSPLNASAKDPYDVLGVKKDSSASDIKKAYYQLAKKWHPDSSKEKNASEKFHEIQAAYDILSDDNKRQAYDRYGSASTQEGFDPDAFARGGAGGFGGFQDFGSAFGGRAGNAGDLFSSLFGGAFGGGGSPFGGGGRPRGPVQGDDLETVINLSFLEACNGIKRKISITPVVDCKPCSGSGLKPGQKRTQCATCKGTGQQTFQVSGMYMASTCQTCGGQGSTIPRGAKCGECDGVGRVKEKREVEVDIPAGVEDGMTVRVPGVGDMPIGASGPPGSLLVRVNVKPSAVFRRQGANLYHDAKVPLHTALLGGRVRIPTLEGDVEVRVREGTQNGEEAVLKGRGVRTVYGRGRERGDLVVGWKIQIPRSLSPKQKKILQAFADDVEGRPTNIHFDPPENVASPPPPSEPPQGRSSGPSTSSPSSEPPKTHSPSDGSSKPHGLGESVASAVGGAIGWVERMLGGKEEKK